MNIFTSGGYTITAEVILMPDDDVKIYVPGSSVKAPVPDDETDEVKLYPSVS